MVIEVTFDVTDVYISTTVSPVYVNVSFEAPSGGGGTEWGDITGTLSDQTDLQTALEGKFDDPTGTSSQYIDGTGALQTFPLTLPVLQEVRNQTGATLDAGTVVYINGATGNKPTVTKAIATGDATSAQTLGMVSASIANNGTGYVVVIGTCSGLDTSAFTEGQQLYLSYTTAGAVTTTKPYAPYHLVYIGIVTRAHPTLGTVEVRVQNGYELDEIHDVDALNPNNNDGIFYNSTTSLWEHKQISTALGYTPANAATTLTINGVTYDLSTSRTYSVGTITGSGASGQVAYWTGASSQSGSNNLFWDASNSRLGIGTNAPATTLDVRTTGKFFFSTTNHSYGGIQIGNSAAGSSGKEVSLAYIANVSGFGIPTTSSSGNNFIWNQGIGLYSSLGSQYSLANVGAGGPIFLVDFNGGVFIGGTYAGNAHIVRPIANSLVVQEKIIAGSVTDSGQRLQVQGTTLLNGNVTFSSATGMTWDATNSRLGIGTNAPVADLIIKKSADVGLRVESTNSINEAFLATYNSTGEYGALEIFGSTFPNAAKRNLASFTTSAANGFAFIVYNNSATANFSVRTTTSETERLRVFGNTGNVLIQNGGTFTDTGERLQVTGTMKVTGGIGIGSPSLSSTTIFDTILSSSSDLLARFWNNGTGGMKLRFVSNSATSQHQWTTDVFLAAIAANNTIGLDFRVGLNASESALDASSRMRILTNGNVLVGTTTDVASAILNVSSTTKGFLPPRMTTTQKNAISSPAAGLVVYDTTDNKHYGYDGTTWNAFY